MIKTFASLINYMFICNYSRLGILTALNSNSNHMKKEINSFGNGNGTMLLHNLEIN